MDREYIIAGFRIRLEQADRLFVRPGSHMARAFEPFAAEADPAAPLTMRLIPDCTINKKLTGGEPNRELDVFPFDDAEADCHFERTPRGYLFRMVPRNGDRPTLFFKAFDSPDVQSDLLADGREPGPSDRCSRPAPRHSPTTAICRIESAVRCRTFSPKPLCGTWPACRTRQRPNSPTPRSSKENREPENN